MISMIKNLITMEHAQAALSIVRLVVVQMKINAKHVLMESTYKMIRLSVVIVILN